MTAPAALGAARDMLVMAFLLVSPFMLVAILVSLVVGLLQASTRINDLTLSFVPRFFAVLVLAWLLSSWAGQRMVFYIERSAVAAGRLAE